MNHRIFLGKLEYNGFKGIIYFWLKSYLTDRTQVVAINCVNANELTINRGVSHGSVLGQLMFLIYINDIYKFSEIL